MNAKGRFDPEQLLADARGGRRVVRQSTGAESDRPCPVGPAQIGFRLQGRRRRLGSRAGDIPQCLPRLPPLSRHEPSRMGRLAAQDLVLQLGPRRPEASGGKETEHPAGSVAGPASLGNGAVVGNNPDRDRARQPTRARPAASPGAANARLASPISWLDCRLTTGKCSSCGTWRGCRSPRWPAAWAALPEPSASSGCAPLISSAGCCKRRKCYEGDRRPPTRRSSQPAKSSAFSKSS